MSRTVVFACGIAVAVVAGTTWWQKRDMAKLHQEITHLRDDLRSNGKAEFGAVVGPAPVIASTGLQEDRARPAPGEDLAGLREEIAALRKSTKVLTQFAQTAQAAAALKNMASQDSSVATKLIPAETWKNSGRATPEATAETVLWAAVGGEVDTLSQALAFTPMARDKADRWFATLSESTRKQYGTPEKVLALMIAKDAATVSGMQVLGQKEVMTDHVGVRVRLGNGDGKLKEQTFVMRRGGDGWRMLLPDDAVEKFARQLSGGGK